MQSGRVAVVGYGVVGKRVADAVHAQPDLDLVGVVDVVPSDLVRVASDRGFNLYLGSDDARTRFDSANIEVAGTMDELLPNIDIVVDCSPAGVTARNIPKYQDAGIKWICEGGEKHDLTGFSFSSFANYGEAFGRDSARVVSCNTTSQCRVLSTLDRAFGIEDAFIAITRRGVDPVDVKGGPINATIATLPGFSHHAPDINTVIPALNVKSMAVVASTTLMHVHTVRLELAQAPNVDDVAALFASTPRFRLVSGARGISSTAQILEWARDNNRPRNDHWEVAIWEDSLAVDGNVLCFLMAVHMESVIVPENVDCIRSMCELEKNAAVAIARTDESLGILRPTSSYASLG